MNDKQLIPIFNARLAKYLDEQGYILDHTEKNRQKQNRTVYFYKYVPGIYDDMKEYRHSQYSDWRNNEVPVYGYRLAIRLLEHGYTFVRTEINADQQKVIYFANETGIEEIIKEYQRGRKYARAKSEKEVL